MKDISIKEEFCTKCNDLAPALKCSICKKFFCMDCFANHYSPEESKKGIAKETILYYPACYICSGLDHPNYKTLSRYIEKPSEVLVVYDEEGRDHSIHMNCAKTLQKKLSAHQPLLSREKIVAKCHFLSRIGLDVNKVPFMETHL